MKATHATAYKLEAGTLMLEVQDNDACIDAEALFSVAQRINPRRSFLFLSKVLGRHIPVAPSAHFRAIKALVDRIDPELLHESILVMGYAETAVGLGAGVARALHRRFPEKSLRYLSSTRHEIDRRRWFSFSEGHSHAPSHHVLQPTWTGSPTQRSAVDGQPEKQTLILVDDEVTTGATFAALMTALRQAQVPFDDVVLLVLTDWSADPHMETCVRGDMGSDQRVSSQLMHTLGPILQAPDGKSGKPIHRIRVHSLLRGAWAWHPIPNQKSAEIPLDVSGSKMKIWHPQDDDVGFWAPPRLGLEWTESAGEQTAASVKAVDLLAVNLDRLLADAESCVELGDRHPVLVIGTGEHVWGPMLVAENLELRGRPTRFVATTRSPILQGGPIRHKFAFPDHFGLGIPMYLHNVPRRPAEHVIVFTECDVDSIGPELRHYLGRGLIVDVRGAITEFCC